MGEKVFHPAAPIGDEGAFRRDRPEHGRLNEQAGEELGVARDGGPCPEVAGGEVWLDRPFANPRFERDGRKGYDI